VRLWKNNPETPEGKYLVQRRDGTIPQWPSLVLGGADPAAVPALLAYADEAEQLGYDPAYVSDIRSLAEEFMHWQNTTGVGDADAPRHRKDDPAVIALMRQGNGS
jgi:hypothetical protein